MVQTKTGPYINHYSKGTCKYDCKYILTFDNYIASFLIHNVFNMNNTRKQQFLNFF